MFYRKIVTRMDKKPKRLYAHEIAVMRKVLMHYLGLFLMPFTITPYIDYRKYLADFMQMQIYFLAPAPILLFLQNKGRASK